MTELITKARKPRPTSSCNRCPRSGSPGDDDGLVFNWRKRNGGLRYRISAQAGFSTPYADRDWLRRAKLVRAGDQHFACAPSMCTSMHKVRSMPEKEFKREVKTELTGRETGQLFRGRMMDMVTMCEVSPLAKALLSKPAKQENLRALNRRFPIAVFFGYRSLCSRVGQDAHRPTISLLFPHHQRSRWQSSFCEQTSPVTALANLVCWR